MHESALCYHDIIEAEHLGKPSLRYIRVAQRSDLKLYEFMVYAEFLQMTEVRSLLGWVYEQCGFWQNDFGGFLSISTKPHAGTDFLARWDQAEDAFRRALSEGKIKFKIKATPRLLSAAVAAPPLERPIALSPARAVASRKPRAGDGECQSSESQASVVPS